MPRTRKVAELSSSLLVRHPPSAESYQAAVADDLASTVEHLLNSRYSGTRMTQEPSSRPRMAQTITDESLLAELAAARRSGGDRRGSLRTADSAMQRRSSSFLGRAFAGGCVAIILLTLVCMSPFRDYVPSPLREPVDRVTQFALATLKAR
jgi:hypothetical protein